MKPVNKLIGLGLAASMGAMLAQADCGTSQTTTPADMSTPLDLAMFAAPTVTSVAPISSNNAMPTNLTITGTGFRSGATVTVGGVVCASPVVVSATSITCMAPARASACGPQDIVVTHPDDGKTGTGAKLFTYRSSAISFAAAAVQASGALPDHIVTADFNKDGKLDLASTSRTAGAVQIHIGVGNGTFVAPVDYTVGTTPIGLIAVDLNKDGNLDLVVANNGGTTISVLDGTATGTFAAARPFTAGSSPHGLTTADVNENYGSDYIGCLFNTCGSQNHVEVYRSAVLSVRGSRSAV